MGLIYFKGVDAGMVFSYFNLKITGLNHGFPGSSAGKQSAGNSGNPGSIPGLGRAPGEWLPTLVFLPGEFHGQRSLVGYSPWGHKESDTTK